MGGWAALCLSFPMGKVTLWLGMPEMTCGAPLDSEPWMSGQMVWGGGVKVYPPVPDP